jgi:putative endonuclease
MPSSWNVYMLRTATGALYTGITTDVERRLKEHASGNKGAKSLRGKGPLSLVLELPATDRSEASSLEFRIKQLTKEDKERLVSGNNQLLATLRD